MCIFKVLGGSKMFKKYIKFCVCYIVDIDIVVVIIFFLVVFMVRFVIWWKMGWG